MKGREKISKCGSFEMKWVSSYCLTVFY